uniref:Uncharacterized protein n=1 Tax=Globodera pallida TaxID=36090 RepID=A0A183C7F4_GLOPA
MLATSPICVRRAFRAAPRLERILPDIASRDESRRELQSPKTAVGESDCQRNWRSTEMAVDETGGRRKRRSGVGAFYAHGQASKVFSGWRRHRQSLVQQTQAVAEPKAAGWMQTSQVDPISRPLHQKICGDTSPMSCNGVVPSSGSRSLKASGARLRRGGVSTGSSSTSTGGSQGDRNFPKFRGEAQGSELRRMQNRRPPEPEFEQQIKFYLELKLG